MSFIRRFFTTRVAAAAAAAAPTIPLYMGAGCVFTDGKHILAGYQPHKKHPGITGIGGHKEEGETYLQTAYRETIEELFHVRNEQIPIGLIDTLVNTMTPRKIKLKKGYVLVTFTFTDLEIFLKICKKSGLRSPLYSKLPRTLFETIQLRAYNLNAEISVLCLLPVVSHDGKAEHFVSPYFIKDICEML